MPLTTVLQLREKEKENAQIAHHQSQKAFEEIATELYTLLKKKETAEGSYASTLSKSMPIDKIKEQLAYIEALNVKIMRLQDHVNRARKEMEEKQSILTEAYVEVKKFEKVIENRNIEAEKITLKHEQTLMDELSIRQYLSQNR
ncbi:flagellar export protein FliJ [Virgibacillus sp. W0181]|uniref:flagellar export protein FliJ n=1 Tax=Virgibacillus sp. W0181 TaxID=3391581 RepID=UPI003F45FA03